MKTPTCQSSANLGCSKLLINEPTYTFQPTLAALLKSVDAAIFLQQLHYLLGRNSNGRMLAGRKWIYNSYESWQKQYFSWLSVRTLQRLVANLEGLNIVLSIQPEGKLSRRKYYTIHYELMEELSKGAPDTASRIGKDELRKIEHTAHKEWMAILRNAIRSN